MRTTTFLLTLALLNINLQLHGQWTIQNYEGYSRFNKIKFRSATEGFMIGDHSLVLKTIDGGINWNTMNTGAEVFFQDFQFINDSILIGSGFYYEGAGDNMQSKVLKSTDNGSTWQVISIIPNKQFFSQWFFNEQVGLLSGYEGIYRTANGGISWNKVSAINHAIDNSMYFIDDSVGFVGDGKSLLKTEDQGQTWSSFQNFNDGIHSIYFADEMKGFVGSIGKIYKTYDGGTTWQEDSIVNELSVLSIDFISDSTGYLVSTYTGAIPLSWGFTIYTAISRTYDGGISWESYMNPGELYSVDFIETKIGYISGANNLIMKYTGGDLNELPADYPWKIVSSIEPPILSEKIFPNPVTDKLSVELSNPDEFLNIELFSLDGRFIKTPQTILGNTIELDLSQQSNGVYVVKLKGFGNQQIVKILKK